MTYDQKNQGAGPNNCNHDAYHLRINKQGVPNSFGFIEGARKGLLADGTPNAQAEISSSWQLAGGQLDFEGEHFSAGGGYVCTP